MGVATVGTEVAGRVDAILAALREAGHPLHEAAPQPDEALQRVHDPELLDFLRTAYERWRAGGYVEAVGQDRVVPYYFPTPALVGDMPVRTATAVHADAGRFAFDTMTLIGPGTWEAARAAVDCAVTAVDLVAGGEPAAYALCRPPGHHATRSGYGGSCYLNNAAVAAEALRGSGFARVGVVDLDAHHGNGTQAIFWDRADVRYGSVHVDPGAGWFPHVLGFADETGAGPGQGATLNLPLAPGSGDGPWLDAVGALTEFVAACDALVVSLGVDAAAEDPESPLQVTVEGYAAAGRAIGATGRPCVVVQEGGYHVPTLGRLVAAYLEGHRPT